MIFILFSDGEKKFYSRDADCIYDIKNNVRTGMRRPSWNKSQAIQQVISLKTLLETPPDSDSAGKRKKLYIPPRPRPDNVNYNSNNNPLRSVRLTHSLALSFSVMPSIFNHFLFHCSIGQLA